MKISRYALILVAASAALTACSRKQVPPQVATVTVAIQPVLLTTELSGRTSPYRIAEIRPRVSGLIQERLFTEGTDVKEGQELYQIDPSPFQAFLDNAKASLDRAQANLPAVESRAKRYKNALAEGAVSQQEFDDVSATLNQAHADIAYYRAMVETASSNLGYTHVVSPITGRIGKSSVTVGAIVTAYQPAPLATIQQLDPIYVEMPLSTTASWELERRLRDSQDGSNQNKVQLILEDGTVYPLEATLEFRESSVDPIIGSVILRAVFPNPNRVLLPSMFLQAVVQEGVKDKGILIPKQSVGRDPKGTPFVWVVCAQGKVDRRLLSISRAVGDQWLVDSGLKSGEHIVVQGLHEVRSGTVVQEVPFEQAESLNPSEFSQVHLARNL
jgi:membrane fusion protein (multidrug efflux system)